MNRLLKRLGRKTLSTHYLPEIDGLRFVAIFAVILFHLADDLILRHHVIVSPSSHWLADLLSHGDRGVPLFFSISGFILAIPFAKKYFAVSRGPDLKRYLFRRLTRLEPPYILNVLVCAVGTWAVNKSFRPLFFPHLLAAVTYTHGLIFHYNNPINMVWWSLEIETQFYFLMPMLALIFTIQRPLLRRGIWILSILVLTSAQHFNGYWIVNSTILGSLQYFLAGILLADLYQSGVLRKSDHVLWSFGGMAALGVLFLLPTWWKMAAPAVLFVILAGAMNDGGFKRTLSYPWVAAIGGMCYTIYLWHLFVLALVLRITSRFLEPRSFIFSFCTQAILILPTIFVACVVLFLLVEKPCMEPGWPSRLRAQFSKKNLAASLQ